MEQAMIFVVTHKEAKIPQNTGYYPMVVGNHTIRYENGFRDNTDINIAEKNPHFCELTALYWIWKNVSSDRLIGLFHYRRYLCEKFWPRKKLLSIEYAEKTLKEYDIILPFPKTYLHVNVEEFFVATDGKQKDVDELRKVICERTPEYLQRYDEVMHSHSASFCNMFVATKELMDQYCEWLFDILFTLEERTDLSEYTPQQARIYGFLAERLLNVWVRHHELRVKYLYTEELTANRKWWLDIKDVAKYFLVKCQGKDNS